MPTVIACYKWVYDEQDIKINPASLELDTSRAKCKISEYDRNAIEEAVIQAEKCNASVACLTFGTNSAKQSLKDALSRGPGKAYWVNDRIAETADGFVTANILAAALRKIGEYDIVLCGEGSADAYGQQVGPRLATLLGIPVITFVTEMKVEGNKVTAVRKIGDCTEVATVEFPVVITVLPEINKPRIPSLKQVLGAAKKPVAEWHVADLGLSAEECAPRNQVKSIKGFVMSRKNILFKDGTPGEKVAGLIAGLSKEGAL